MLSSWTFLVSSLTLVALVAALRVVQAFPAFAVCLAATIVWFYGAPCCCVGSEPHRRSSCALFLIVVLWITTLFYVRYANQAGSLPFVGKSTCSSEQLQDAWPYNAASPFKFKASTSSADVLEALKTPFQACVFFKDGNLTRWGDMGVDPVRAFQAGQPCVADTSQPCSGVGCDNLPTTDPRYWFNAGRGLLGGIWPRQAQGSGCRSVATDSGPCPYVASGRGPYNCPLYLQWWRDAGLMPNPDPTLAWCPPSLYVDVVASFYFLCPGAVFGDPNDGESLKRAAEALFVCAILFTLDEIATFLSRCRPEEELEEDKDE